MNKITSSIYISSSLFLFLFVLIAQEFFHMLNPMVWFFPTTALIFGIFYLVADFDAIQKKNAKDKEGMSHEI
jgi:hypothetical protein